jgi:hypothetical protein
MRNIEEIEISPDIAISSVKRKIWAKERCSLVRHVSEERITIHRRIIAHTNQLTVLEKELWELRLRQEVSS